MTLIELVTVEEGLPIDLGALKLLKIYRILKLLRIIKFKNLMKRFSRDPMIKELNTYLISNTWLNEVVILVIIVVFFIHYMACMYKEFNKVTPDDTVN